MTNPKFAYVKVCCSKIFKLLKMIVPVLYVPVTICMLSTEKLHKYLWKKARSGPGLRVIIDIEHGLSLCRRHNSCPVFFGI
jgi:hypothetical protein